VTNSIGEKAAHTRASHQRGNFTRVFRNYECTQAVHSMKEPRAPDRFDLLLTLRQRMTLLNKS